MDKNEIVKTIKSAQQGDKEAFEQLFNSYSKGVYFSAYKILGSEQAAQDVTQEVFTAVYLGLKNLKSPSAFSSWIMKIAAFQCGHYLRGSKDMLLPNAELDENSACYINVSDEDLPQQHLENSSSRSIISHIIDTLPSEQKTAVVLFYFNELSVREIAKCLNVTESAVKSRLQYARQKIKQEVLKTESSSKIRLHSFGAAIAAALAGESEILKIQLPLNAASAAAAGTLSGAVGAAAGTAAAAAAKMVAAGIAVKAAGVLTAAVVCCAAGTAAAVPVVKELTSQVTLSEIKLSSMELQPNEKADACFELNVLVNGKAYTLAYTGNSFTPSDQWNSETQKKLSSISFSLNADGGCAAVQGLSVQGVKNGSAELIIRADFNKQAVTGKAAVNITTPVTEIKIAPKIELVAGNKAGLNAKILPETASDKSVIYESLNPEIAVVNENGEVTAIKAGKAKIKAACKEISAISEIIVSPRPESIELAAPKTSLIKGETVDISAAIKPEGCAGNIIFKSDNEAVIAVDQSGKATAVSKGSAVVTASVEGFEVSQTIAFNVKEKQAAVSVPSAGGTPAAPPSGGAATGGGTLEAGHYHGNGTDWGRCPVCGQVYNQNNLPSNEGEHVHSWVYVKSVDPDCNAWGVDIMQCQCGLLAFPIKYPPVAHNFSDWEQKTAPTATEAGLSVRYCRNCLYEETQSIAPTG